MKAISFVAALFFFLIGCSSQQGDQLTQQQQDQIKSEVKAISDSIWARFQRLEMRNTLEYYGDSSAFLFCGPRGTLHDWQSFKGSLNESDDSVAIHKFTVVREEHPVVTSDHVVFVCAGTDHITLKSGDTISFERDVLLYVFRKIDGSWKIVYEQESATVTTQKAGKK